MYNEGEDQPQYEADWKAIFERDYCGVCKNRKICPYTWKCHDMEIFIEDREEEQ